MRIGNRQGWILAAIVAVVYAGLVYTLETAGSATPPTPLSSSEAMAELSLPPGADTLVSMPEKRDASEIIRRLTKSISANTREYEHFSLADIPRLPALGLLVDQTPLSEATKRAQDPDYAVGYNPTAKFEITAFDTLSTAAQRAALLCRADKRPDDGKAFFEGEYSLGYKLFAARQTYADVRNALLLMSDGVAGLKYFAKDSQNPSSSNPETLAKLQSLEDGLLDLGKRSQSVWRAIGSIDPALIGQHAGDIPLIAQHSKERAWRVEATLKLGRMRYSVGTGTGSDQRNARRLLRQLLTDPDPAVAHAAKLANDLTIEDYRTLR